MILIIYGFCFFFFKQKTAYEMELGLEFRRVLFRSAPGPISPGVLAAARVALPGPGPGWAPPRWRMLAVPSASWPALAALTAAGTRERARRGAGGRVRILALMKAWYAGKDLLTGGSA